MHFQFPIHQYGFGTNLFTFYFRKDENFFIGLLAIFGERRLRGDHYDICAVLFKRDI